jgi:hypothetical protein
MQKMMKFPHLRKLVPAYKATINSKNSLPGLITANIPISKQVLSKHDVFLIRNVLKHAGTHIVQSLDAISVLKSPPYLSELVDQNILSSIVSDEEYCNIISKLIAHSNLRHSSAVKLAEAIATDRFKTSADPEKRALGVSLYLDFCLKMMDVKYFEKLKTMID